jgi:hypothetical protein
MSRLGYICDHCGEEHPRRDPAAAVRDEDGNWLDLCASCYDDWDPERKEVVQDGAEVATDGGQAVESAGRETHIDDERGLFIPEDLREFDSQIVFRTPRATIQHFGSQSVDAYYGMIYADQFGDPDEMRDPKNPELAPNREKIKPQGEEPVTLTVDVESEIRADGGTTRDTTRPDPEDDPFVCSLCGVALGSGKRIAGDDYCDACQREHGMKPPIVRCLDCGENAPQEQCESIDVSGPNEYYPDMRYLCPGCQRDDQDGDAA